MKTTVPFNQMQTLANLLDTGVDLKDSTINGHINELTQSLANLAIMRTYDNMEDFHKLIQSVSDSIAYTLISHTDRIHAACQTPAVKNAPALPPKSREFLFFMSIVCYILANALIFPYICNAFGWL